MAKKAVKTKKVGIMTFSFAIRKGKEPSVCNRRLGKGETMRAVRHLKYKRIGAVLVSQWEPALSLPKSQKVALVIREHRVVGRYLDSREVWAQAEPVFRSEGVDEIIVIANRFLHLTYCKKIVRESGFKIYKDFKVRPVGFDKKSCQWQTTGPVPALIYAIRRAIGFNEPPNSS